VCGLPIHGPPVHGCHECGLCIHSELFQGRLGRLTVSSGFGEVPGQCNMGSVRQLKDPALKADFTVQIFSSDDSPVSA
jgi:hypothetical protein